MTQRKPAPASAQLVKLGDAERRLRAIRSGLNGPPALVIHGDADPLIPLSGGEDTALNIPGAELFVISGAGHDIFESLVPTYAKAIGNFAAKVEEG